MASLQEQLLKNGLIDAKKAKQANKDKRKETNVARRASEEVIDPVKEAAEQARLDKQARDRKLNMARQDEIRTKEIAAQIKQLILSHKQSRGLKAGEEGVDFNFTLGKTIKKIRVSALVREQLARGLLGIGVSGAGSSGSGEAGEIIELLPRIVVDKIAERDPSAVVIAAPTAAPEDDDPYKDYVIPDDLMW